VRPGLSPCENLGNAGLGTCRAGANLTREFEVVSPIPREVIARSRNKLANPRLRAFDITGADAPWGEYLTPLGIVHPEFGEINLDAINTPVVFDGIPWNLDRRLSPGGCSGPCESTPQPLLPFPFSGINPASEPTLPAGGADRIFSFFPFGTADRLAWPPPAPDGFPILALPDAPLACEPPLPGGVISDSSTAIPLVSLPPSPGADATAPVADVPATASPLPASTLPLASPLLDATVSAFELAAPGLDAGRSLALTGAQAPLATPKRRRPGALGGAAGRTAADRCTERHQRAGLQSRRAGRSLPAHRSR
jgi:hypothetical protein